MILSVIVPTFNGGHKIINLLGALEKQTFKTFEVIIVIDGSTDYTKETINSHKFNFQSLRIIEQSNQGRSIVRNNGAKAAEGDLLIFFDDDMIPLENCIEKHIEHHQKHSNSILTGGIGEDKTKCVSDIQLYKAYISNKWSTPLKKYIEVPLPKENIFITAANFSISRKIFLEFGGFDENLKDAEDFDLAVRAFQKNIPLYYKHSAFAWHNDKITCLSYIKRQREYTVMHKELLLLKPELYITFQIGTLKTPSGLKALIFRMFTFKFWIFIVDNFNWLRILPKRLRYKVYDCIITANGVFFPQNVEL